MLARGADVAEPGTTLLRKGTVLPLLTDHPVAAPEARVDAGHRRERRGLSPISPTPYLQFSLPTAEGVVTQGRVPREQKGWTSPCCIADLFGQEFWMEILFHFLD